MVSSIELSAMRLLTVPEHGRECHVSRLAEAQPVRCIAEGL